MNIGKTNVTKLLTAIFEEELKEGGAVTLLKVPADSHMEANTEALRILINDNGFECVYITLSKSFTELDAMFKKKGLKTDKIYYIDAISQMYGEKAKSSKRCVYTFGPLDIDSISSSLRKMLPTMKSEKKCVFLDSITTVLLYNSMPRTIRFSQFLTKTLKELGVKGVMVSLAKGKPTEQLIKELSKMCDVVVDIK